MTKIDLKNPDNWIPREVFAAYCGPHSDKLLAYYDKAKAKRQLMTFDFDWLAFLALPAWLGYRQQWSLWGTLVGVFAACSLVEALTDFHIPNGAFGGAMIALGLMARGLLLSNATGIYLKQQRQGLEQSAIQAAMAGRASPRVPLAFVGLFGALVSVLALPLLIELRSAP